MAEFTLVKLDDWQVLYEGDVKIMEGHRLTVEDVLAALQVQERIEIRAMDGTPQDEHASYYGSVPDSLAEFMALEAPERD